MNVYNRDVLDPDDQAPLQNLIEKYPLKQRKTMVNAMNTTHFMYDGGTFVKHFISSFATYNEADYSDNGHVAGYGNTTSAVDAIDFKMSSGNVDAGEITLFGVA